MSAKESYPAQVALLRSWRYTVKEEPGCYGRSNGSSWATGDRFGQLNHHYVSPLSPPGNVRAYVDAMRNGNVVNWVIDAAGIIYLIGTGPMNHAGKGDLSVFNRIKAGQAPTGWHPPSNAWESANRNYDGVELLHPGDSSPYPDAMIAATVALNASRCIILNQPANSSIMHGEHTNRKIDMSWRGGSKGDGAAELRRRVAALIASNGGTPPTSPNPPGGFLMALSDAQQSELYESVKWLRSQLGDGIANGQKTVGTTIAATLGQAQTNQNKVAEVRSSLDTLLFKPGVAPGQSTVGGTIAATLRQAQANGQR